MLPPDPDSKDIAVRANLEAIVEVIVEATAEAMAEAKKVTMSSILFT